MTVAADAKGAAAVREWIEAAAPSHPSLLDEQLRVAELYHVRNVPAAFWIDERGEVVRANDPIYALRRDRATGETTPDTEYRDALRDWVAGGGAVQYAQDAAALAERRGRVELRDVEAATEFRLGVHLAQRGRQAAAQAHFERAHRLRPENWTYRRQAWSFEGAGMDTIMRAIQAPDAPLFYPDLNLKPRRV